jgi:hypothetical protein
MRRYPRLGMGQSVLVERDAAAEPLPAARAAFDRHDWNAA